MSSEIWFTEDGKKPEGFDETAHETIPMELTITETYRTVFYCEPELLESIREYERAHGLPISPDPLFTLTDTRARNKSCRQSD